MTVAELIVRLQQLDQDAVVVVPGPRGAHGSHERLDPSLTMGSVVEDDLWPDRCGFVRAADESALDMSSPLVRSAVLICWVP